jgi:hypothetical protein
MKVSWAILNLANPVELILDYQVHLEGEQVIQGCQNRQKRL